MNNLIQYQLLKRMWMPFCLLLGLLAFSYQAEGQEQPPRPISVSVVQGMNFGAFVHGGGEGTVIISPEGSRSKTGDIYLTNIFTNVNFASFDIIAEPGTLITIRESISSLGGSNGGSLVFKLGKASTGNPFIVPYMNVGQSFRIDIGGILEVGSTGVNPPGNYSGTFQVTFDQQ